jgi:hypothetical protein
MCRFRGASGLTPAPFYDILKQALTEKFSGFAFFVLSEKKGAYVQ